MNYIMNKGQTVWNNFKRFKGIGYMGPIWSQNHCDVSGEYVESGFKPYSLKF